MARGSFQYLSMESQVVVGCGHSVQCGDSIGNIPDFGAFGSELWNERFVECHLMDRAAGICQNDFSVCTGDRVLFDGDICFEFLQISSECIESVDESDAVQWKECSNNWGVLRGGCHHGVYVCFYWNLKLEAVAVQKGTAEKVIIVVDFNSIFKKFLEIIIHLLALSIMYTDFK